MLGQLEIIGCEVVHLTESSVWLFVFGGMTPMDRLVQGYQSAALLLFTSWQLLNASWGPTWPRDPAIMLFYSSKLKEIITITM